MAQLKNEAAVVLMHATAQLAPERDAFVAVDGRIVRKNSAAHVNGDKRRYDRAYATFGELKLPIDARLVAGAVVVVETPGDVGAEDAVLDGQVAETQRFPKNIAHRGPPVAQYTLNPR